MAHRVSGAPLVMRTLMAHLYLVRHSYIAVAHHIHGAPLMSTPVVCFGGLMVDCGGKRNILARQGCLGTRTATRV